MSDVNCIIGAEIRKRRLLQKMPQPDLAKKIGVSFQQLQKYEYGANRVPAPMVVKICQALGCTPNDLLWADAPDNQDNYLSSAETALVAQVRAMDQKHQAAIFLLASSCGGGRFTKRLNAVQ
jgi:transcriptional regulator with XRE-family HTH domain